MKSFRFTAYLLVLAVCAALGVGSCNKGTDGEEAGAANAQTTTSAQSASSSASEQQAVVYTCPMHPQVQQDKPGKCPSCGMDLVKKA